MSQTLTYEETGVVSAGGPLQGLLGWVNRTLAFRQGVGASLVGIGHYANVLRLNDTLGLAIATDGVGTKILVAEMLRKYDTLGIDCIAMNVNDIICVGAEPLAMVDYLAVQVADPDVLEQLGRGLYEGARQANITIPGGELAQVREMLSGVHEGEGIDVVGACVGLVQLDRIILGDAVQPGDVVVGLASSGIHSNGFTLARRVLFEQMGLRPDQHHADLGRSVGEELLEPTLIYVQPVWEMLTSDVPVRALYHITGDGLLNMNRGAASIGYRLHTLPHPPAIFQVIQQGGAVPDAEMYRVFNMGVGFCVVTTPEGVDRVLEIARQHGVEGWVLGEAVADPEKRITLTPRGLVGVGDEFRSDTA